MVSVSGTYRGMQTTPSQGALSAVLRVDIDRIRDHSLVINAVSGDLFRGNEATFLFSWVGCSVQTQEHPLQVIITGDVTTSVTNAAIRRFRIIIKKSDSGADHTAMVTFTREDDSESTYDCVRTSEWFREVTFQVDVCRSVRPPRVRLPRGVLPSYDTHSVNTRPKNLSQRHLSMESAFADAGIKLSMAQQAMVINDTSKDFRSWSNAELHLTMELNSHQLKNVSRPWPRWQIWGLIAGQHDDPINRGMMFDASAFSDSVTRQGFAVFVDHPDLRRALARTDTDTVDPEAVRMLLRVLVHEAAHTFNLRHPDACALSWMNRPHIFDAKNSGASWWELFPFSFTREELVHLRHGEFRDVAMGGNPAAPTLADSASFRNLPMVANRPEWTIDIRSQGYFDFLEPVELEVRIRNCSRHSSTSIDSLPTPESGNLMILIKRPDGSVTEFQSLACCCRGSGTDEALALAPCTARNKGKDRVSCLVDLTTGVSGCRLFDAPGNYEVRVVFRSANQLASSAVHRIRVGTPLTRTVDRLAQDYFNFETSLSLALGISRAETMRPSFGLLESIVYGEYSREEIGEGVIAKLSRRMAKVAGRPFHQPVEMSRGMKMKVTAHKDTVAAKKLIETSLEYYRQLPESARKSHNLAYADTARTAIAFARDMGDTDYVVSATNVLLATLKSNGVSQFVRKTISQRLG